MRKKILSLIDKNSKLTVEDMAIMLDEDKEAIQAEIVAMEADKVICGYTTLINWDKVDDSESITALIEVKVTPQRGEGFDKIAERIYKFDEVEAVYLMSGAYDLTVIMSGKTMRDIASFVSSRLATMEDIVGTTTHFILKKYKEHGIALSHNQEDERMLITP